MATSLPVMPDIPVYGLALTGGRSLRMGTDKAALAYQGQPQLERLMSLLTSVCTRAFVSARADQQDALRQRWPVLVDPYTDIGPMAGLLAAQQTHANAAWLIVACDMPHIDANTLHQLLAARDAQHDSLAFASTGNAPEPMCSLWEPPSAARVVPAHQAGQHSLLALLTTTNTKLLTPPHPQALHNINTPDQYDHAQHDPD